MLGILLAMAQVGQEHTHLWKSHNEMTSLFVSVNRRMDEWVPLNRIDLRRSVDEECKKKNVYGLNALSGGKRITRSLKRKYNEINHIEKVSVVFV